jgi:hypothetical protein
MYKDFRNELMFQSLKEAIPATQCKFGGTIKPQQTLAKTGNSRAYKGYTNTSEALKAEAEYILRNELIPLETMVYAKQRQQIAEGKGSRIPAKFHKQLNEIKGRISKLKRTANDLANTVADHHYQTNQVLVKV